MMTPCDNLTINASAVFWQCHFEILRVHPNMLTSLSSIHNFACSMLHNNVYEKAGCCLDKKKME